MIKKLIHYTWFSGEEMPDLIKKCIDSWHKYLPDYEFKLWDRAAAEAIDSVFLKEALSVKKWAFVADYVRLYAVYHEGGIYLDTDVELRSSFDPFLNHRMFIGKEHWLQLAQEFKPGLSVYLTSHCFGAEAGHPFLKRCLDYYAERHFIVSKSPDLPEWIRYDHALLPYIQACIAKADGYNHRPKVKGIQMLRDGLAIYPSAYFDGESSDKNCVVIHHCLGSWRVVVNTEKESNFVTKIKSHVAKTLYHFDIALFRLRG